MKKFFMGYAFLWLPNLQGCGCSFVVIACPIRVIVWQKSALRIFSSSHSRIFYGKRILKKPKRKMFCAIDLCKLLDSGRRSWYNRIGIEGGKWYCEKERLLIGVIGSDHPHRAASDALFQSAFFKNSLFGYSILRYDKADAYDDTYRYWAKSISNGPEFLKAHRRIQFFDAVSVRRGRQ